MRRGPVGAPVAPGLTGPSYRVRRGLRGRLARFWRFYKVVWTGGGIECIGENNV